MSAFSPVRLRAGEWLVGGASVALLVVMFTTPWYGLGTRYVLIAAELGRHVDYDAWQSLHVIRFLILILALGGILTWWLQATCAAPAIPVCATVLEATLGIGVTALLVWRAIDPPGIAQIETKAGGYVGLGLAAAIVIGGYISMRQDQAPSTAAVESLRLTPSAGRS